jgi:hypothetical protein
MSLRLTSLIVIAAAFALLPMVGCGGQQNPEAPVAVADQAPPPPAPADATDTTAQQAPPPAESRPSQPTRRTASVIPEERSNNASAPPPAPAPPTTVTLTIPAGTSLNLGFAAEVTSATAVAGDAVTATLKDAILVGDRVAFPAGSQVHGTFSDVKSASKGFKDTGGALSIQFHSIVAPDGHKGTISAAFTKVAEGSAAKKGGIIGGSAVGGALLGKALGKSTGGGAAIGAAIGTAVAGTTKGREAVIKADDTIQVALEQDAKVAVKR